MYARCLVLAVLLATCCVVENATACSCKRQPANDETAVAESFGHAAIVFLGRVESMRKLPSDPVSADDYEETEFYVLRSWKGEKVSRVYTRINLVCCVCGRSFEVGATYLVYAYERDDGYYRTSRCSRTAKADSAADDMAMLPGLSATRWRGSVGLQRSRI